VAQIWDSQLNPIGVLFGFAASASLTVHFIMGERVQRYLPTNVVMTYGMGVATLFFLPFANLGELDWAALAISTDLGGNLSGVSLPLWFGLIFMGLFGSFAPMALVYLSLRHLSATLVGVVATAETVLAALFALLWLGEQITTTQALGGIVVVAGILIAQTARRQKAVKVVD
jgi:drug/metabolite transporter (DMT)-like permease